MFPMDIRRHVQKLHKDVHEIEREVDTYASRLIQNTNKGLRKAEPIHTKNQTKRPLTPQKTKNCGCEVANIVIHTCGTNARTLKTSVDSKRMQCNKCKCHSEKSTDTNDLKMGRGKEMERCCKCRCKCGRSETHTRKPEAYKEKGTATTDHNMTWADLFVRSHNDSISTDNTKKTTGVQVKEKSKASGCTCSLKGAKSKENSLKSDSKKASALQSDLAQKLQKENEEKDRVIKRLELELARKQRHLTANKQNSDLDKELKMLREERATICKEAALYQMSTEKLKILLEEKDMHFNLFQKNTEVLQKRLLERLREERQKTTAAEIEKIVLQVKSGAPDLSILSVGGNDTGLGHPESKVRVPSEQQKNGLFVQIQNEGRNISIVTSSTDSPSKPQKHSSPRSKGSFHDMDKAFDHISAINNIPDESDVFVPI